MCSAPNLQLTLRLKNGDKQSFSNDVCDTGGQVNLELLHKAVSTMQKDTNEVLTKLVEQERETTKNGNVNNSKTEISEDEDDEDEEDEVAGKEPPEKIQRR